MGQSVICAAASAPAGPVVSVSVADVRCDLLELFAGVSDGRVGPGRDHPAAAVLALYRRFGIHRNSRSVYLGVLHVTGPELYDIMSCIRSGCIPTRHHSISRHPRSLVTVTVGRQKGSSDSAVT